MPNLRRLNLIESHLNSKFPPVSFDTSLDDFRNRSQAIDSDLLLRKFLGSSYDSVKLARSLMTQNPLFNLTEEADLTREELRERVLRQLLSVYFKFNLSYERDISHPLSRNDALIALAEYDMQLATRLIIHLLLYIDSVANLGTQKHLNYVKRAYALVDYGSFGMTEMGHGSNVSRLETTAVYDKKTREFIINSPTATSAKWWIGGAGKTANMSVVFAQLLIDDVNRGVHVFLVPIRDHNTHETIPGVVVGDCGKKIGLEGVDNGFLLFKNYRVPYDALLDKFSQITTEGKYKSTIKNNEKRLSIMMAGLIKGRSSVVGSSEENLRIALTISIRYAALRKQFGFSTGPEIPLLDYQLHKYRLIPYLAKIFAIRSGYLFLNNNLSSISAKIQENPECIEMTEHHAILSSLKAVSSWYSMAGIQECRESLGGFGYSAYAGIGRVRNCQDIHLTWEGDNSVLIQQAGKFIFKSLQNSLKGHKITSESLKFLRFDMIEPTLNIKFDNSQELENGSLLYDLIEFRLAMTVHHSLIRLQDNSANSTDVVEAWNNTQVFYVQELGRAFAEYIMTKELYKFYNEILKECQTTGNAVKKLYCLYTLGIVEKNLALFLEAGMNPSQAKVIRDTILKLCNDLGNISIRIIDALAPADNVLGSVLGASDGQAYKRMIDTVENTALCYEKATWFPLLQEIRENGLKVLSK